MNYNNLSDKDFIGLSEEEGRDVAKQKGLLSRVTRIDEERFIVTQELNPNRINFEIDDGRITKVHMG